MKDTDSKIKDFEASQNRTQELMKKLDSKLAKLGIATNKTPKKAKGVTFKRKTANTPEEPKKAPESDFKLPKRKRTGRPRKRLEDKKTHRVTVRLTEHDYKLLQRLGKKFGMSSDSETMADILRKYAKMSKK